MENDELDADALRLQLQQAIEFLRHSQTLIVQAFGFFVTADVLLLTYGFSQRSASGLLAASLMPLAMLVATWLILTTGLSYVYIAIRLERDLLPGRATLVATTVRMLQPAAYNVLDVALGMDDAGQHEKAARAAKRAGGGLLKQAMSWVLMGAFVLQVVILIIAVVFLDYRLA